MKLYKVDNNRITVPSLFIKSENIQDALYKARKYYESMDSMFNKEFYLDISSVVLISNKIIE